LESGSDLQLALMFVESKEESVRRLTRLLDEMSALFRDAFKLRNRVPEEKAVVEAFKEFERAVKNYLANANPNV
jgi:hypothetical protein